MVLLRASLVCLSAVLCCAAAEERLDAAGLFKAACTAFTTANHAEAARLLAEFDSRYAGEPEMSNAMPRVLYLLGCAQFSLKQMDAALGTFTRHLALSPQSARREDVLLRMAAAHQALGAFEDARKGYESLLEEFPRSTAAEQVRFQIAACMVALGQFTNAVPLLRTLARSRDPLIAGAAGANLLNGLVEAGELASALRLLEDISRRDAAPDHIVFLSMIALRLGDKFHDEYHYAEARAAYRSVLRRDELMRRQAARLGDLGRRRAQCASGHPGSAVQAATLERLDAIVSQSGRQLKELGERPEFDLAWLTRLGRCCYDMGMRWEACIAFREAVRAFPDSADAASAHLSLVFCLNQMGLYDDARRECDAFIARNAAHPQAPQVALLKAESFINQERYAEAEEALKRLLDAYPAHAERARVLFLLHLAQTLQEEFADARAGFSQWLATAEYRTNALAPEAQYWFCMALLFSGDHTNALLELAAFVSRYPNSTYRADAEYRIGVARYMLGDYKASAIALLDFCRVHTNHAQIWEARVLRGDALAAMGRLDVAIKAYAEVSPARGPYHHYAVAQTGKCLKALEDYTNMVALYTAYLASAADSPNVVEGVYWLGWAHRQLGNAAAARDAYWDCLRRHGNRRDWSCFDDLVRDLGSLYRSSQGWAELAALLQDDIQAARSRGMLTLASRLELALIKSLEQRGDATNALALASAFASRYRAEVLGADGLMFIARRSLALGDAGSATGLLSRVASVFTNAVQRAEAELLLARTARCEGRLDDARSLLDAAEQHARGIGIFAECSIERADLLLASGRPGDAIARYEAVLANRAARGPLWPRALLGLGAACEDLRDFRTAIPYYQRVYVMYAGHAAMAAKAYYRSGRCFEQLGMTTEAANSYRELLADPRLGSFEEAARARSRLDQLGGTGSAEPADADEPRQTASVRMPDRELP